MAMRFAELPIVLALVLAATSAMADLETVMLAYEAPADACPTRRELEAEIRARTSRVAFGDSGRRFEVHIDKGEAGFVGTLSIRDEGGAPSERRIDGTDCAEVASALGLIAALAIDHEAKTAPRSELELEPEPAPPPAAAKPGAKPRPEPAPEPIAPSKPVAAERMRYLWSVGLGGSALRGPAPVWLVALRPELEVSQQIGGRARALGVALYAAQSGVVGPSDDRARFGLFGARLALSPFGLEQTYRWRISALLDAGVLRAEGRVIDVSQSAWRLWLATGVGTRFGRRIGERWYLDLSVAALANLTRDRFVFESPRRTVYQVPWASFDGGISAGWLFP